MRFVLAFGRLLKRAFLSTFSCIGRASIRVATLALETFVGTFVGIVAGFVLGTAAIWAFFTQFVDISVALAKFAIFLLRLFISFFL